MGLTVKQGPYSGWWVMDGDKVVAWCAEEEYTKKYLEAK